MRPTRIHDQNITAGPPEDSEKVYKGMIPSKMEIMLEVRPKFVKPLKMRFTSCVYPNSARRLVSSESTAGLGNPGSDDISSPVRGLRGLISVAWPPQS